MKALIKISLFFVVFMVCHQPVAMSQDTLLTERPGKPVKQFRKGDPTRATMLALAFPGLGQIHNRKYWKVPLVYAGFGGLVYAVSFNSKWYNAFLKGYQDFNDQYPETISYMDLPTLQNYDPKLFDIGRYPAADLSKASWAQDYMLKGVDYFKKYRDLSYIGFGLWYLITVLDANVDASLLNYDISDDLSLEVAPVQMPLSTTGQTGVGVNFSLRVNF